MHGRCRRSIRLADGKKVPLRDWYPKETDEYDNELE